MITMLAAALASSLSVNAAAQSDAAFASSLAEGAPSFAVPAQLKAKAQKPAAKPPKGPEASEAVWQKVLETVKRDGKYKPGGEVSPSVFSLQDKSGDEKADHSVIAVSFLGLVNDEEQFEALGALFVVQEFKLDPKDGNWRIDQWMFETDVYGAVGGAGHGVMIQTPDGKKVSATPEQLNPSDPRIQAKYDEVLKHWAERKPEGA